ncbi:MAG: pyridoxal-phosphate dependent enzyme [Candidatus Heimdallarchaeota archaeon]|nr:pyridoxal-phosphate dependent enzyme [Candidatus Heimdallarchaeota archaeon]
MIDLTIYEEVLERSVQRARDRNIIIPTFNEQKNPLKLVKSSIKDELKDLGLWEVHPRNLFRITWYNEPKEAGGGFRSTPNYIELPAELTGVEARIIAVIGKWFPTGAHKVGAAYACLVPRLVTGQFDPTSQKAVWPSTGNYCRGGAYDSHILGCESIAILPEEMSKERFEWLKTVSGEVIATPGSESNVKEIYDKCHELKASRGDDIVIFNQFDEFGNHLWHYEVTGNAIKAVLDKELHGDKYRGCSFTTGSAGTIGCGDFLKEQYPTSFIAAGESVQCPTLLENGFGAHRIEGIGDKHVPWVHNVKNTDFVVAIDDRDVMNWVRLFNEPAGRKYLKDDIGVSSEIMEKLDLLGISSMANVLFAIKMAKYYEMTSKDVIVTCFTDSMEMYQSRVIELRQQFGEYNQIDAAIDYHRSIREIKTDYVLELTYPKRKRVHNLKYFTWIEQQGKTSTELDQQWYQDDYWTQIHQMTPKLDELINQFNEKVGLL